jgi:hypothetical protein
MSDDVQIRHARPTEVPPRPANSFVEVAAPSREPMIVLDDDEVGQPAPPTEALIALFRRLAHEREGQSA